MHVLDVLPLSKGPLTGTLSYRSNEAAIPGTVLKVPLKNRSVLGIVLASTPVAEAKASLKRATFALKGATLSSVGTVPEYYLRAAHDLALFYATSEAAVLTALLAPYLERGIEWHTEGTGYHEAHIEDTYAGRVAFYRKEMRKAQTSGRSSLLLAPTRVEALRLADSLAEFSPVMLTGEEPVKKREKLVTAALAAGAVIATPSFAWLPLPTLGLIVVERAGAGTYLRERHPYLDMREAARAIAKTRDIRFIAGDLPLPLTLRPDAGTGIGARVPGKIDLIDARPNEDEQTARTPFRAIPEPVMARLVAAHEKEARIAVLAARRGFSPSVVCRDCGTTVKDASGRTLSYAKAGGAPVFRSADGKTVRAADIHCAICGSWNLLPLGIGVERVVEELHEALPNADIIVYDAGELRKKGAAARMEKRANDKGAILVGTEAMLAYLDPRHPVDEGVIASADSLLALPFWSARERLVRIGLAFRERARHLTILSRNPDDAAFVAIEKPGENAFWEEEAALRTRFLYPPAGHLLVLHAEGREHALEAAFNDLKKALPAYALARLPDRRVSPSSARLSAVAKVAASAWPDADVSLRLAALSPSIRIHVDPESLW